MIEHARIQHPVGQGSFHSAVVRSGTARVRYVYDCGSDHRGALYREINRLVEDISNDSELDKQERRKLSQIDLLLLSHLDRDHLNGIDRLLALTTVDTVVLPYLEPFERVMLVAKSLEEGTLDGGYVEMAGDLEGWFGRRGVQRVVYVRAGPTTDRTPIAIAGEPGSPTGELDRAPDVLPIMLDIPEGRDRLGGADHRAASRVIGDNEPLRLRDGMTDRVFWALVCFVYPEPTESLDQFRNCVSRLSPLNDRKGTPSPEVLRALVTDPSTRSTLAACYREIRADRNLTSLCLYSGPPAVNVYQRAAYASPFWRGHIGYARRHPTPPSANDVAWLGTGDSVFAVHARQQALAAHLKPVWDLITTLVLPHHGSHRNFHRDLLGGRGLRNCVASAGATGRYGHPASSTVDAVRTAGKRLAVVTERTCSSFAEEIRLW